MASIRVVLALIIAYASLACASPFPMTMPDGSIYYGVGPASERTRATVEIDGRHESVVILCTRGCAE